MHFKHSDINADNYILGATWIQHLYKICMYSSWKWGFTSLFGWIFKLCTQTFNCISICPFYLKYFEWFRSGLKSLLVTLKADVFFMQLKAGHKPNRIKICFKHYPFGHLSILSIDTKTHTAILWNHGSHFIRFPNSLPRISSRKINKAWIHDMDQSGQLETISIPLVSLFTSVVMDG